MLKRRSSIGILYADCMAGKSQNTELPAQDARVAPTYNFHEAAKYLRLPVPTLRSWSIGHGKTESVFKMDDPQRQYLSFMNLVEAHILAGIRRRHGVGLPQVRRALDFVQRKCGVTRPLIHQCVQTDQSFQTDGRFLFIEQLERLINASKGGQLAMPDLLPRLDRIQRDPKGLPLKLFPFTRATDAVHASTDPKIVVMNPRISFGHPVSGRRRYPYHLESLSRRRFSVPSCSRLRFNAGGN